MRVFCWTKLCNAEYWNMIAHSERSLAILKITLQWNYSFSCADALNSAHESTHTKKTYMVVCAMFVFTSKHLSYWPLHVTGFHAHTISTDVHCQALHVSDVHVYVMHTHCSVVCQPPHFSDVHAYTMHTHSIANLCQVEDTHAHTTLRRRHL